MALTLKCLLSQTVRADRTILWVAAKDHALLPNDVLSLKSEGLEIRLCKDIRSYKKIYPALIEFPDASIVTADDDVYYAPTWLAELVARAGEKTVVCHRAHSITVDESGLIKPYRNWTMDVPGDGDMLFPTGVGGVLYTPGSLASEVVDEAEFQRLCPNADDVWLFWMGRRAGSTYHKASAKWRVIPWKGTQDSALYLANVEGSGNDAQIANMLAHFGPPEKTESHLKPTAPSDQPEPRGLDTKATAV
ncbi:glycosyltransferase family 2 protein [Mesorhizobium sp. INR15]|uniref:glycosyltransferase family 2 protein n=1 Tax=Mesorhizobium sp. INR15 TaxID=2654248 RepID=UPI0018969C68|nr:glycosyltransferase family 2 protein [Mesorhizobium sp. INR15]